MADLKLKDLRYLVAVADTRRLRDVLVHAGWRQDTDLDYHEAEGGTHSEGAWAARVGQVLSFLYPGDFC